LPPDTTIADLFSHGSHHEANIARVISGAEPYTPQDLQELATPLAETYEIKFEEMGEGGGLFEYGCTLMIPALAFAGGTIIRPWWKAQRRNSVRSLSTCWSNVHKRVDLVAAISP